MKTMNSYVNKILNFVTTIIIILLFISVVASFQTTFFGKKYNSFFGYALFEIKTASMSGSMEIGDWILIKVTNDVALNDIITFEQDGSFITHRIIEQYKDTYITKGDSNNAKDTPITKEQIVGRLVKVMPKFGIVKKTFFNPKVLIVLIITIVVGTSLFDKNNNKQKTNIITSKILNKPKKEKKIQEEEFIDLKEFEKIEEIGEIKNNLVEKIETHIQEQTETKNTPSELSNTMVLSRIVVDMNSKTLASISKHLEDTTTIEPIKEEKKEVIKPPKKITTTNKKILLGKNEKNLIKKVIELKENEIIELTRILLNKDSLDGELKSIVNKFSNFYIEQKYINQGDLDKETSLTTFKKNNSNNIVLFANTLIDNTSTQSYKNKVNQIANAFLIINKIDATNIKVEEVIESSKSLTFEEPKKTIKELKTTIKHFDTNLIQFCKKLETGKFDLLVKSIAKENLYKTNISSNIQFSKLFSDYSIDKTYNNEVIIEDLRELQLKMLSLRILTDMFEFSYKKKYLIYLNDTIYSKEKKLKSLLGNIDDIYSQGKINILLDIKTLMLNYDIISELSKDGYRFSIELDIEDLDEIKNIRKYLCIGDYLFIKNNNQTIEELMDKIPSELENKIINIDKSLLEGPVIK
jgi:signal peptidase